VNTTDQAALSGHIDTKEEEVYQDLCSIQNIARNQVFLLLIYKYFIMLFYHFVFVYIINET
jgi:hypothetical protein